MPNWGMDMPEMGTIEHSSAMVPVATRPAGTGMADVLFGSTQQRVLGLVFGQPDRSFYASELIALTRAGSGAVQRELRRLADSGLVSVRVSGKQKHYQANRDAPICEELVGIVRKTMGLADPIRSALEPFRARLRAAFVFGSVARREDVATGDIDLMLVGDDLSYPEVYQAIDPLTERLGRKVNPTIYGTEEFEGRIRCEDGFVKRVLTQPRLWLIGNEDALATR
jgi:predicted nucleotidyltransferase